MREKAKSAGNELINLSQELQNAELNVKAALNATLSDHDSAGDALRNFLEADAVTVEIKRKIRRLRLKKPPSKK